MTISNNKVVTLDYTLTDDQGTVIDQSTDGSFAYLHGANNIIPGLEQALEGKQADDEMKVSIEPQDAYGERNPEMIQVVQRSMFDGQPDIEPGMQFHAQSPDGHMMVVTVAAVEGDNITIDANPPLAGVRLHFDVKIRDVRDASEEEMDHGHVHGPDGHNH